MAREPEHRRVFRELLAEVAAGRYAATGRLPSEAQLVTRFGVSRPTVGRALKDLQDQGLVERRAGSGTFLKADAASTPLVGPSELGLLIPGLGTTEIFEVICGEIASLARVHDQLLLWGGGSHPRLDGPGSSEQAEQVCDLYLRRQVAGVFFAPMEHQRDQEALNRRLAERLRLAGVAVILLDRDLVPFPGRSDFDVVGIDNVAGGYLAADHLLKLGALRPRFVSRPGSAPTVDARAAGFLAALLAHGLAIPPGHHRRGEPDDPAFVRALIEDDRADALVCANDQTAATLIRSLARVGVRVPTSVRITGFDDVRYATLVSTPLTTIHQPCRDLAEVAYRAMLERISQPTIPPRMISVNPTLIVRESCGAYARRPEALTGADEQVAS